jgi:hypothetical protein
MLDLLHPLDHGHAGADPKNQDGDNEGPEIQLQPVAERMFRGGRARGPPKPIQQQELIACVHD